MPQRPSISLTPLAPCDRSAMLTLYNEAFPADERRIYRDEKHLGEFIAAKTGLFNILAAKHDGLFAGFISWWQFDHYAYIEHFATAPPLRGNGIGSEMLNSFLTDYQSDVLLEVEPPVTPEALRRIEFYRRHGFRTRQEINYIQPPYSPDQQSLPMILMTHGDIDLNRHDALRPLMREVYGCV